MQLLTKKHDETSDEAGHGHADAVRVPVRGVEDDRGVVAGVQREGHISRGENLQGQEFDEGRSYYCCTGNWVQ